MIKRTFMDDSWAVKIISITRKWLSNEHYLDAWVIEILDGLRHSIWPFSRNKTSYKTKYKIGVLKTKSILQFISISLMKETGIYAIREHIGILFSRKSELNALTLVFRRHTNYSRNCFCQLFEFIFRHALYHLFESIITFATRYEQGLMVLLRKLIDRQGA